MQRLFRKLGARIDTAHGRTKMRRFREGWPSKTSDDIQFYRSPKVQYRYREQGSGVTIVFVADPPSTLEFYDELLDLFSEYYRVLVVELPAMGFSAAQPDYEFGWLETNADLTHFLRDVAGRQAVLAFSCVAGLAAVDIAVRSPELVSKLILLQTADVAAFARWKSARDPQNVLARSVIGQLIMKKVARNRVSGWYGLSVGNRDKVKPFCTCATQSLEKGAMWSLASAYQNYMDPSIVLAEPKQPILAIWGASDGSHTAENAISAKSFSSNVTYLSFENLGHFPELEDPNSILLAINDFLNEGSIAAKTR